MKEETNYVKRTQLDYTLILKLNVVIEIESRKFNTTGDFRKYGIQASCTVVSWLRKYGNFDWENQLPSSIPKSP